MVKQGVINVTKCKFLKSEIYASKHNRDIYFDNCDNCPDQCGVILSQRKMLEWIK